MTCLILICKRPTIVSLSVCPFKQAREVSASDLKQLQRKCPEKSYKMEPVALTIHIIIGMLRQLAKNLDGIVEERIEEHNLEWSDVSSSDEESIIDVEEDVERTDDYTAFFNTVRDEVKGVLMKNIADLEEQLPPEGRDKDEEDEAEEDQDGVLVVAPKSVTSSDFCMTTVISFLDMVDEQIDSIFKKYLEQLDPSEMLPGARRPSR